MSSKGEFNHYDNGVDSIIQRSSEIEGILNLSKKDQRLYIHSLLEDKRKQYRAVGRLKKVKKRLKEQNANLQETEKKLVELQTLNETLRRQLVAFCDMTVYASIGFTVADAVIDWITTDFGSLTEGQGNLFVFGLLLRVFGVSAIWCCLHSANLFKYLFKKSKKHVETNSCEVILQLTENVS